MKRASRRDEPVFEPVGPMRVGRHRRGLRCRAVMSILALLGLVAGCDTDVTWTMMPAPVIMKDPRFDFTRLVAPDDRDADVRVLYATTRAPAPSGARERYRQSAGDALRLGLTEIQLGEPGWSFADLVESDRAPAAGKSTTRWIAAACRARRSPWGSRLTEPLSALDRRTIRRSSRSRPAASGPHHTMVSLRPSPSMNAQDVQIA
jgi:hypothetical protein